MMYELRDNRDTTQATHTDHPEQAEAGVPKPTPATRLKIPV